MLHDQTLFILHSHHGVVLSFANVTPACEYEYTSMRMYNDNDNDNEIDLFRHHNGNNTNVKVIFKQVTMLDKCKCI